MDLINTIGMECAIMKWDTNRVQKAENREEVAEFCIGGVQPGLVGGHLDLPLGIVLVRQITSY